MPKKPEPPKPTSWDVYKIAKKAVWLGTVEAPDKRYGVCTQCGGDDPVSWIVAWLLRRWNPITVPVLDHNGDVVAILHHVEDVTGPLSPSHSFGRTALGARGSPARLPHGGYRRMGRALIEDRAVNSSLRREPDARFRV
jgi:hypothetical protein